MRDNIGCEPQLPPESRADDRHDGRGLRGARGHERSRHGSPAISAGSTSTGGRSALSCWPASSGPSSPVTPPTATDPAPRYLFGVGLFFGGAHRVRRGPHDAAVRPRPGRPGARRRRAGRDRVRDRRPGVLRGGAPPPVRRSSRAAWVIPGLIAPGVVVLRRAAPRVALRVPRAGRAAARRRPRSCGPRCAVSASRPPPAPVPVPVPSRSASRCRRGTSCWRSSQRGAIVEDSATRRWPSGSRSCSSASRSAIRAAPADAAGHTARRTGHAGRDRHPRARDVRVFLGTDHVSSPSRSRTYGT